MNSRPPICVGAVREPPTDRANPNNMGDRCCVGWGGPRVKTARAAQDVGRFTNRPYGVRGKHRARIGRPRPWRHRADVSSNNSRPSLYVGAVREPPTDRTHPDDMGDRCCVGWGRTPRENDARREREWCRTRASENITAIPVCGRFTNRPYGGPWPTPSACMLRHWPRRHRVGERRGRNAPGTRRSIGVLSPDPPSIYVGAVREPPKTAAVMRHSRALWLRLHCLD